MQRQQHPIHPVVQKLRELIITHDWVPNFDAAIKKVYSLRIKGFKIQTLDEYLEWINDLLYWVPSEDIPGREVYNKICQFYIVLDQETTKPLQNKIVPNTGPLTPLSAWMVEYAKAMGAFLDTPESLTPESLETFRASKIYNLSEYVEPHGGWKSFNQFFARHYKPGYRPIAALADPKVIVSPADSTFVGQWEIRKESQVTVKTLHWTIEELLAGSPYKDRFVNGIFMHAFLNTTDYHRQHAPVGGRILESRFIPGQVYLDVVTQPIEPTNDQKERMKTTGKGPRNRLFSRRRLGADGELTYDALDGTGYQFSQARGLIVIDSPIGLVAVLPIGMAQVSSVVITAEEGVTVMKGEEISYFQFGGSDIVVLFEQRCNVSLTAQPNTHYKVGTRIGEAYPAY